MAGDLIHWHVYTCDGQRFGPISKAELDRWAEEKRLTASCQLYQDGWPAWRMAREFYPNLPPAAGAATAGSAMAAAAPNLPSLGAGTSAGGTANPYAAPMYAGGSPFSGTTLPPHRGSLILVLGILGWAICCAFALPALIMGVMDLGKMKRGEMDNSGYGMTMTGLVLAIVQCVLLAIVALFLLIAGVATTNNMDF